VRIGARHHHEGRIGARVHGCLEAVDHLSRGHQRLAWPVTAALGRHLILEMHAGGSGADQIAAGAGDVEGAAETGVSIDQQRQLAYRRDAAHVLAYVVERGDPQVRQAEGGVGNPGTGEIDRTEAGALGEQRRISVDRAHDLQRALGLERRPQALAGAGLWLPHAATSKGALILSYPPVGSAAG